MKLNNDVLHYFTVFIGFLAMLNPFGILPIFIGMVEDLDDKTARRMALKASVAAFLIIASFCIFGHFIFRVFGITIPAFQIAGGIIVFFIGYHMLNGEESQIRFQKDMSPEELKEAVSNIAVTPLGMPLLAGPGTIATAMNFVGSNKSLTNVIVVIVLFAIICFLTYLLFLSAKKIASVMGTALIKIITRVMGLILTVIAIQMLIMGIIGAIKLYTSIDL
ncbi:MAG: MarC family protein [Bacteroidota bacterium]|jgi:multiple antibiotic resistance protein